MKHIICKIYQQIINKKRVEVIKAEIVYPDDELNKGVLVSLSHVRAADDILITYDLERDGYVIHQASNFEFTEKDIEQGIDEDWQEVAFIKAWGREV